MRRARKKYLYCILYSVASLTWYFQSSQACLCAYISPIQQTRNSLRDRSVIMRLLTLSRMSRLSWSLKESRILFQISAFSRTLRLASAFFMRIYITVPLLLLANLPEIESSRCYCFALSSSVCFLVNAFCSAFSTILAFSAWFLSCSDESGSRISSSSSKSKVTFFIA